MDKMNKTLLLSLISVLFISSAYGETGKIDNMQVVRHSTPAPGLYDVKITGDFYAGQIYEIYIDTDNNKNTGYETIGAEYLITRGGDIFKYTGPDGGSWSDGYVWDDYWEWKQTNDVSVSDTNISMSIKSHLLPELSSVSRFFIETFNSDWDWQDEFESGVTEAGNGSNIIHGGKLTNSGSGGYYQWDDEDAVRGLVFDAYSDFKLKSVKVYNQAGQEATRVFTLFDASGNVVDSKSVFVGAGEQRIALDMFVPKGNGYKLMADIHKGLYRNRNIHGYPYKVGDVASIVSSDIGTSSYYFFYDWAVESLNDEPNPVANKGYYPSDEALNYPHVVYANPDNFCSAINNAEPKTLVVLESGNYSDGCNLHDVHHVTVKGEDKSGVIFDVSNAWVFQLFESSYVNFMNYTVRNGNFGKMAIARGHNENHHIYFGDIRIENCSGPESSCTYTSAYAHDITLNRVQVLNYDSKYGYGWYCQGYHQTVTNSTFAHMSVSAVVIRGHYPVDDGHVFGWAPGGQYHEVVYGNPDFKNINTDDWTHYIANNTFAYSKHNTTSNDPGRGDGHDREAFLAFYTVGPSAGDAKEYSVYPPQNVVIENNKFYHPYQRGGLQGAISVDWGFPKGADGNAMVYNDQYVILHTVIRNNLFSDKMFRIQEQDRGDIDTGLITLSNNKENANFDIGGFVE